MTDYLSYKLKFLYAFLILMVISIHSYYMESELYQLALFLQKFWGSGICSVANCMFFCISGYLFARNISGNSILILKLKRKLKTILLPYILWNIIFVLWYVILDFLPVFNQFNNSAGSISAYLDLSFFDFIYDLFIKPAAFHLWFIRDLLVMFILSPILIWIINKSWRFAGFMLFVFALIYPWIFYFGVGLLIAIKKIDVENYPYSKVSILFSLVIYVCHAVFMATFGFSFSLLDLLINLLGIYLIWSFYDIIYSYNPSFFMRIEPFLGYSFFIYCFHEPAFNVVKKLSLYLVGINEINLIILYFINPVIMYLIAVVIAKILKHSNSKIYSVLSGDR